MYLRQSRRLDIGTADAAIDNVSRTCLLSRWED
jgi:hypothetical protein